MNEENAYKPWEYKYVSSTAAATATSQPNTQPNTQSNTNGDNSPSATAPAKPINIKKIHYDMCHNHNRDINT